MGAVLDRNGLRPSRYYITDDDYLILSSEVGVLDIDPTKIVYKETVCIRAKCFWLIQSKASVIDDDESERNLCRQTVLMDEWLDSIPGRIERSEDSE